MATTSKNPKVLICGAGVGGLTVAHELAKRNFDVIVYEKNARVGGMARSKYHTYRSKKYPVEYSWRVYGNKYKNLHRLLHDIPLRRNKKQSVFHNLIYFSTYIFARYKGREVVVSRKKSTGHLDKNIKLRDNLRLIDKSLYCLTMSTGRMNSLDHVKWKDYCSDLSPEAKKFMVQLWGPVLGMDTTYMSFPVIARMVGAILASKLGLVGSLYLLNKPTNDGWFDEWTEYLQQRGVIINTNCEIKNFKVEKGKISTVQIKNVRKNNTFTEQADYIVCGLPVEGIAGLVSKNKGLQRFKSLRDTIQLAKKSRQVQLSVQIFLNKKLRYPTKEKHVLYLPDTPWSLIIEPQDKIWGTTYSTDKNIKSVLSVGICQTDSPGIVYKKPFVKCTKKEIRDEVWGQIKKSYKHSNIVTEDGEPISTAKIVLFYMWDSFKAAKKGIKISEPKFSNNVNTLQYQPSAKTEIKNFFFATGYTKTNRYIFSMESATEAGIICANEILKRKNLKPTKVFPFQRSIFLFAPLMLLDKLFYKLGLPHPSWITFKSSILYIGLYIGLILVVLVVILGCVIL